jgi:hypothetical protein
MISKWGGGMVWMGTFFFWLKQSFSFFEMSIFFGANHVHASFYWGGPEIFRYKGEISVILFLAGRDEGWTWRNVFKVDSDLLSPKMEWMKWLNLHFCPFSWRYPAVRMYAVYLCILCWINVQCRTEDSASSSARKHRSYTAAPLRQLIRNAQLRSFIKSFLKRMYFGAYK